MPTGFQIPVTVLIPTRNKTLPDILPASTVLGTVVQITHHHWGITGESLLRPGAMIPIWQYKYSRCRKINIRIGGIAYNGIISPANQDVFQLHTSL